MNAKYDQWQKDSPRWRAAIEQSLSENDKTDVVIHYKDVALAFPSRTPHASTFDYPRIDESPLRAWASAHGWDVQAAPEMEQGKDHTSSPIRFTKA